MTEHDDFLHALSTDMGGSSDWSALKLAYLGDAVFEIMVRTALFRENKITPGELHKAAKKYVSAAAQSKMYHKLEPVLDSEEMAVMKHGRNAKSHSKAKNATIIDYRHATGVEALFGYLYLKNNVERLTELFNICYESNLKQ